MGSAFTPAVPPAQISGSSSGRSSERSGIPAMSSMSSTVVYAISYPTEKATVSNSETGSPLSRA